MRRRTVSAKALKGFGGRGVLEIVEDFDGDTYRAVYTVRFAEAVYVLRSFRRRSKTRHRDAESEIDGDQDARLRAAEDDHRERLQYRRTQAMTKNKSHQRSRSEAATSLPT